MVSRLLGKLDVIRHLTPGSDCAIAGADPAARMPAKPAFLMKERRSMDFLSSLPRNTPGIGAGRGLSRDPAIGKCEIVPTLGRCRALTQV